MRCRRACSRTLALLALLAAAAAAEREEPLLVTGVAFEESAGEGGAALGELVAGAMRARGVAAHAVTPPDACLPPHAPDAGGCARAVLAALARGELAAAVLPAACGSLPAPPRLREAGLAVWGALERGGGSRRGCWTRGALLSLPELSRPERAREYAPEPSALEDLAPAPLRYFCGDGDSPAQSSPCGPSLATAVVGPDEEARSLLRAAAPLRLRLQVVALGPAWLPARALQRAALVCGRGLAPPEGAHALAPPPCAAPPADCEFDARPLLKVGDARALARRPAAARALDRLALEAGGARALAERAAAAGVQAAVAEALAAADAAGGAREVRVAVLVPLSTRREVERAEALRAAAELAEADETAAGGAWAGAVRYKVQVADGGCSAVRAAAWLSGALGGEYGSLSGAAGPACASAFPGAARQGAALGLPVLAYTAQEPAGGALLAAGSLSERGAALGALLAALGWRRAALLSSAGSRGALPAARLVAQLAVHVELPETEEGGSELVEEWAAGAASAEAPVLVVVSEDARAVRAALCAAARRGLTPERGAAVVLAQAPRDDWLRAGAGCDLRAQAEGHLRLQAEWAARWERAPAAGWSGRWRARVSPSPSPGPPPASAALLYDVVRLWARALARLLAERPAALDDLHREDTVRWLRAEATRAPYVGVTGELQWRGGVREQALLVQQWRGGLLHDVGRWERGALALDTAALRWATPGGRAPNDGAEGCARRPLATECRGPVLGGLALALMALLAMLAAGAWHCRRRAARDHRARLAAFGMRALGPRGPDRWELPRERVVINRRLGAGASGAVYGGHALLGGGRGWAAVAVKTLRADAGTEEKLDFLSEAEAMKRLSHSCVVRLLGVVTRTEPVCTVMEMMPHGDLKGFLVARRHLAGAGEVSAARLTGMARDAALGLAYLARLRFVHRDVAARNCLVDASLRLKLADFGMTRVVFDTDYYRFERKGMLPVRWMAPESLALGVFSPASDVWSFGVLLYEMITFGALPYLGLPNDEVLRRAKAARPTPLPPALSPQLEALVRSCWRRSARSRPSAATLADALARSPCLLTPSLAPPDALDAPLPPPCHEGDPFLPPAC